MAIIVSDINEGPVVNIAAWFGTTVMILGVCTRIWSKYSVLRKWTIDDALIIATMFLGSTMTATISMTVTNGLGQLQSSLSNHQIIEFQKYGYASQLLYIPALCLTKLTTLVYLRALSPESHFETMNTLLEVFIIIWGLGAEFAIVFQCQLPSPWAIISGKCFNTAAFWKANGAFDILTDVLIVFLPLYLVWPLHMPWKRKGIVVMAFGSRVLIQLNIAIFMSCVSFLRPFLESMVSGGMATTVHSMNPSYAKSSKLSSLFSTRSGRSEPQGSTMKPPYRMENLSEVFLNDSSGTFGKSESNTNGSHTCAPSMNNDEIQSESANTN
ncbi:hypothetical protein F5882DRAFT_506032 [Hyaloscypha sp. PMI_1271]|nr:hypothetical protein F5882DRAFT_506032 [Hyaloscypha sp. PMI_1271]